MNSLVEEALTFWGLAGARFELVAERENRVFCVEAGARKYALRLRRPGYRTDQELWSELQWMEALSKGGVKVPTPVAANDGSFLKLVEGNQFDLLTWLPGTPVGTTGEELRISDRSGLFRNLGREMARMHQISDAWNLPKGFVRCKWDRSGLLGANPVWGRFWDNPTLGAADRELFLQARIQADKALEDRGHTMDYGLIHADLVRENILMDDDSLNFIDFDDGGFGFRLFDLATALLKNKSEPDYEQLEAALLAGYRSVRDIDTADIALFMFLRSATYVGWIMERMDEKGGAARNARFVESTRGLAQQYLSERC